MTKARHEGDTDAAYKWNGFFIRLYAIRCSVILIGGIVGIAISQYSDSSMDFFCDRYGDYDFEAMTKMKDSELKETSIELEQCRHFIRNVLIIMYIPILVF